MSMQIADVVVAGGGIGGTVAALLLARTGARVTLLERREAVAEPGAGLLLHPNGLAVLAGLGLATAVHAAGHVLAGSSVRDPRGRVLLDLPVPGFGPGLDHMVAVRRSALHRILGAAVAAEPAVTRLFGAEVVDAGADGSVGWRAGGRTTWRTADLVIGADGVHSTVRAAGEFGPTVRATGERYLRVLVPRQAGAALEGEFWTPLGLLGGALLDAGTQYLYAAATAAPVARALDAGDVGALARAWEGVVPVAGRLLAGVDRIEDLLVDDVVRVVCGSWHDGRTVLLGDAAHAMAPTLGQGANSALVDAAVLAIELTTGQPMPDALVRYERRRRPAVLRVQRRADATARVSSIRSGLGRGARDVALRALTHLPLAAGAVRSLQQEDPARLAEAVATVTRPGVPS
jgi:2-polyprenyl-6-methoxyphenol hydroxylase-like FAD-dependent oxidoreductase